MYKNETFVQGAENIGAIRRGLLMAATAGAFNELTVAVAYATTQGCQMLSQDFEGVIPNWKRIRKRWLISFDFGITDPGGLNLLARLPHSLVRIPNATEVIRRRLRPGVRFHPKLYLFEGESSSLFSGSANLTPSGLLRNQEQGVYQSWTPPFNQGDTHSLQNLAQQKVFIDGEWEKSEPLSAQLLMGYKDARDRYRQRTTYIPENPKFVEQIADPLRGLTLAKAALMSICDSFWVEVGYVVANLGAGKPGNQIDLQRGSRVFFGFDASAVETNTSLGEVSIRYGNDVTECHMRFGNNSMDKLTLPVPNNPGPPSYENSVLLFERAANGTFNLRVGTAATVAQWKQRSRAVDGLYQMVGGREFGVF